MAVMVDHRRALTGSILAQALEGGLTPCVEIPRSVLIPEAANLGRSVLAYASRSPVAAAYRIAAEALRRVLK
jgi:cellulose biosynthesis protein BcsQ